MTVPRETISSLDLATAAGQDRRRAAATPRVPPDADQAQGQGHPRQPERPGARRRSLRPGAADHEAARQADPSIHRPESERDRATSARHPIAAQSDPGRAARLPEAPAPPAGGSAASRRPPDRSSPDGVAEPPIARSAATARGRRPRSPRGRGPAGHAVAARQFTPPPEVAALRGPGADACGRRPSRRRAGRRRAGRARAPSTRRRGRSTPMRAPSIGGRGHGAPQRVEAGQPGSCPGSSPSPTRRAASARPPPRSTWGRPWPSRATGSSSSTSIPRATPPPASASRPGTSSSPCTT